MIKSSIVKAEALSLGFFSSGISRAQRVNKETERKHLEWLRRGCYAGMEYLNNNTEKRLDPRLLVPGVKSIVSVALNYAASNSFDEAELKLASYALGRDYHDVVKGKLHQLAAALGLTEYRVFCDSAPVLERYWAEQSGLGWIGRNQQLIIPHAGSHFFLGELFVMEEVDEYDSPMPNRCGICRKCVEACPMNALSGEYFDAEKCLSYQTIENRGELSDEAKQHIGKTFYGCDRCQDACPWNRFAVATDVEEFAPSAELMSMKSEDWARLTIEDYRRLFKGSAVKRAKYEGLMRNIAASLNLKGTETAD